MGDLIQFPRGGRDATAAPLSVVIPSLYCAACGKPKDRPLGAADGPCSCGGLVFTSDPNLGVGTNVHVTVVSPVPCELVVGPVTWGGDPEHTTTA